MRGKKSSANHYLLLSLPARLHFPLSVSPFSLPLPSFPTLPLNELRHTHTHSELECARIVLLITAHRHARNSDTHTHTHTRTHTLSLLLSGTDGTKIEYTLGDPTVQIDSLDKFDQFVGRQLSCVHTCTSTHALCTFIALVHEQTCVRVCVFRVYGQSSKRIRNPQN